MDFEAEIQQMLFRIHRIRLKTYRNTRISETEQRTDFLSSLIAE